MVNVAILGFGTVGSGVAEVLDINAERIARTTGDDVRLKYIVDIRDFPGNKFEKYLTKDFSVVENDPDVQIVVETIGGAGIAYEFSKRALMAGKSLVTSNKELVAKHGHELNAIAEEKNVNYLFEASVGGGIPILRPLCQCLAANQIEEIYGILNGTTNYILAEMIKNGASFDDALKAAQKNGYAEANPAADIEGHDACRKICILSMLCFGKHVFAEQVPTEGITGVTLDDVALAGAKGYKIKLLGRAVKSESGAVAAYVAPHLVPDEELIASVDGVMNAITVVGNAVGKVMFYGAGAGKMATASAVVGDVIDAAQHLEKRKNIPWGAPSDDAISFDGFKELKWYVRTAGEAFDGKAEKIGEKNGCFAYITDAMSADAVKAAAGAEVLSMFRILG